MKKLLVLFIASTFAFASCSKDEIEDDLNHKEVKAEHLENSTWTVKHAKVHNAQLDDKDLSDAQKTLLEGALKVSIKKIALQTGDKMYFEYNSDKFTGKWMKGSSDTKWDVTLDASDDLPLSELAELEIRSGRLYLIFNNFDFNSDSKEYKIGTLDLELVPHS